MPEQPTPVGAPPFAHRWPRFPFRRAGRSSPVQTTLRRPIHCRGTGLHNGRAVTLHLLPAEPDTGISFQRLDIAGSAPFRLTPDCIITSPLATVAASPHASELHIATIEHLMAALCACGIDNILIQLDGAELPILDGCATAFLFLLDAAGRTSQNALRHGIEILRPVHVEGDNGAHASLLPNGSDQLELSLTIEFPAPAIGRQSHHMSLDRQSFEDEVAFCRTFVNHQDIALLRAQGLALGGSLENALVIKGDQVLNPGGVRRDNECACHKMLDTIGDLYCAGYPIAGRFEGYKTGHALNNRLLRAVFSSPENWQFYSGDNTTAISSGDNIRQEGKNPLPQENSHAIRKSWSAAS